MAGIFEMNSFIGKFVNLWKAGRNASLKLDSEAGKASVTLKLDLGHPVPPQFIQPGHLHGRGNARDRRRQRRADARKAAAEVEDNRHVDQAQKVVISEVADKSTENINGNDRKGKDETSDNVVQSDLMTVLSDEILYEVEILATPKCTDEDIMECFTINFGEALKEIGIKDERSYFEISKVQDRKVPRDGDGFQTLQLYRVKIKDVDEVKSVIESFDKKAMNWDYQAFTNYKTKGTVNVKEVQKIYG